MTIVTTVAILQFIRPNDRTIALSYGSNVRYWNRTTYCSMRYDTTLALILSILMENQWLSCWITEYYYLVSVGYIRRGNTMKTMVQRAARSNRRAYTSIHMLISEQSSRWNIWLIWNTWSMLCDEPLAKWTWCSYIWLTALTPRGCNRIDWNFFRYCLISDLERN